jgi:hypothetical protein
MSMTIIKEVHSVLRKYSTEQERFDWNQLQQDNLIAYQVLQFCKEVAYYVTLTSIFPIKAVPVLYTILRDGVSLFNRTYPNQRLTGKSS